jgi:hypothetical protein
LLAKSLNVYPQGAAIPASFLNQDWSHDPDYQPCLTQITLPGRCDAYVLDIDGDGAPEVMLTQETGSGGLTLDVYKQSSGRWSEIGQLQAVCPDSVAALRAGQVKVVPRTGVDVELAGRRLMLIPSANEDCSPSPVSVAGKPVVVAKPRN